MFKILFFCEEIEKYENDVECYDLLNIGYVKLNMFVFFFVLLVK